MKISCLVVLVLVMAVAADIDPDRQVTFSNESYDDAQIGNELIKPTEKKKESGKGENEVVKPSSGSETAKYGSLSQGFELHKLDLLTANMGDTGSTIFKALPLEDCINSQPLSIGKRDHKFYKNTEDLYHEVSSSVGVDISLQGAYTFGASVKSLTNNLVSGNTEVTGLSLDLTNPVQAHTLKKECLNSQTLSDNLIGDFVKLDKEIKEPWFKRSWTNYEVFIQKYGSHIVSEVLTGSSIHQYVFARSSEHFSQYNFSIKACASLTGTTEGGNISVCAEYKTEELKSASKLSMEKHLVVRGGTAKTRAALQSAVELTNQKINDFMLEGDTNPSPILYKFYPLWTILKARYVGTDHLAKVLNLEQYYKGFLHYGCAYLKTLNEKDMQMFVLSEDSVPDFPQYVCKLTHEGCHGADDCVNKTPPPLMAFVFEATCGCNGESCVRYQDEKLLSGSTKKTAHVKQDEDDENGCSGGLYKVNCSCHTPGSEWRIVWSFETADVAALSASVAKRRRDQLRKQAWKRCPKHGGKRH